MNKLLIIGSAHASGLVAALKSIDIVGIEVVEHCPQVDTPVEMDFRVDVPVLEACELFYEKKPRRSGQKRNRWR